MHGRLFRGPAILSRGFAGRVLIVAGCSVARAKEPVRCPPEIPNLDGVAQPRRSDLEHHRSSRDREAYEGRAGSEIPLWAGKRRLEREVRSSCRPDLPESPQHRAWRNARELAAQESERLRAAPETTVNEAAQLAAADPPAPPMGGLSSRSAWTPSQSSE